MDRQEIRDMFTDTVEALLVLVIFMPLINFLDRIEF